jgi:ATP-dependent DNA helicase RecG
MILNLKTPLSSAISTRPEFLKALAEMDLHTVEDLLLYFPRAYDDLSQLKNLTQVKDGEKATMRGALSGLQNNRVRGRMTLTKALFFDEKGNGAEVVWFNQPFLARMLPMDTEVIVSGKIQLQYGRITIQSPEVEPIKEMQLHTAGLIPVYLEHGVISSKWIRNKLYPLLQCASQFEEILPSDIVAEEHLIPKAEAVREIHFPSSKEQLQKAKDRLAYEELFLLQLNAVQRKLEWQRSRPKNSPIHEVKMDVDFVKNFFSTLPFAPTGAQKVAMYEILRDFERPYPMMRLLEGDVGSGKTVVAAVALLNAVLHGYQAVLMAPTEVLARQHLISMTRFVAAYEAKFPPEKPINVQLLIGSLKPKEKRVIQESLAAGLTDIVIGTHSLVQESVKFQKLGLAIVDEQHRFGVKQREVLVRQGAPHILHMTATPIPRTLAMVAYGDHDLSVLNEMPPGRQVIETRVVPPEHRGRMNQFIAEHLKKGEQAYVICPLIDESDTLEVKSAKDEYERLKGIFPSFRIGLLHGRMKSDEKDQTMQDFKAGQIDLLVSTSVIEVGIDVPNATIMLIEGADRFGLSQLHQFRGRVGRGSQKSYCFLCTSSFSEPTIARLRAMVDHSDGFQLAEIDLKLRGPGEVYGVRQSGIPDLKIASMTNGVLVSRVRKAAEHLVEQSPDLAGHPALKVTLAETRAKLEKEE